MPSDYHKPVLLDEVIEGLNRAIKCEDLKGIKITKKMYKRISEIGVLNLKNTMLKGLDEFKKFTWSNFVKQEFDNLIMCMEVLDENGIFDNLNDKQLFIVNYYSRE